MSSWRRWTALALLLGLPACASSGDPQAAASASAASSAAPPAAATAPPACPSPPASDVDWPPSVPDDLPVPPGASGAEVEDRTDGLTVVTFSTPLSIRESVLFVIDAMPAAGYTLARGDAENTEADAPFVKGGLRGVLRMIAVERCRTDWLMALATAPPGQGSGTPLLPPRPNASPLPFG